MPSLGRGTAPCRPCPLKSSTPCQLTLRRTDNLLAAPMASCCSTQHNGACHASVVLSESAAWAVQLSLFSTRAWMLGRPARAPHGCRRQHRSRRVPARTCSGAAPGWAVVAARPSGAPLLGAPVLDLVPSPWPAWAPACRWGGRGRGEVPQSGPATGTGLGPSPALSLGMGPVPRRRLAGARPCGAPPCPGPLAS